MLCSRNPSPEICIYIRVCNKKKIIENYIHESTNKSIAHTISIRPQISMNFTNLDIHV